MGLSLGASLFEVALPQCAVPPRALCGILNNRLQNWGCPMVGAASANSGPHLPTWSPTLLIFASAFLLVPSEALGKGGTNLHEGFYASSAGVPNLKLRLPNETFGGCGRGRYRDPHTHKCHGPGDLGH